MDEEDADSLVTDLALSSRDEDSSMLIEITTRIRADQLLALEMLENARRQMRRGDFDRTSLIQEALDLLIEKSFVAVRLGQNKIVKKK